MDEDVEKLKREVNQIIADSTPASGIILTDIPIELRSGGASASFSYTVGVEDFRIEKVRFKTIEIYPGIFIDYAYSKKTKRIAIRRDGWKIDRLRRQLK